MKNNAITIFIQSGSQCIKSTNTQTKTVQKSAPTA